jgi:hypothetical protein
MMKNINNLTVGQSVIFNFKEKEFRVETVTQEKITISMNGFMEREVKMENIYPATEHTLKVSKFARETRDAVKERIPFGVAINHRLIENSFFDHWIAMCNAEGDKESLKIAKANFDLFIAALTSSIEMLDGLKVLGIRLLAPMLPDEDKTN